jgi:short-subunit dehydrogenase
MHFDSLQNKVVVITGASSGIGKLTAEEFLKEQAKVILAARSLEDMQQHLQSLEVNESQAVAIKTDVSDYRQVEALAQEATARFGKIDIWINNAAINEYGYVEDMDIADIDQIIAVDLMGPIYGMKVALPVMLQQGYGTIINIGSIDAVISLPLQSAYDAAKHGMLGFSCALREELRADRYKNKHIDVVDILPASMDTPFATHSKSITDKQPRPMPPIYDPKLTVDAIIKHAKQPQALVVVGASGQILTTQARLMPTLTEWIIGKIGIPGSLTRKPNKNVNENNLYSSMPGSNQVRGGYALPGGPVVGYLKQHPFQAAMMGGLLPWAVMRILKYRRAA